MGRRRKGPRRRKGQTTDKQRHTTISRQTVKVADASCRYDQAFRKYAKLIADRGDTPSNELLVRNLLSRFLKRVEANRAPKTFRRYLDDFDKHHGNKRLATLMRPANLGSWSCRLASLPGPTP